MEAWIQAIEDGTANAWVNATTWLWPMLEIIHFIGLSLLLGAMLVVDLRLAGYLRTIGLTRIHAFVPWAVAGFVINAVSGTLFFIGDPGRYAINIAFQLKICLVAIAGLNALWFFRAVRPKLEFVDDHGNPPVTAKAVAVISLTAWFGVLLMGRLIPYIGTG